MKPVFERRWDWLTKLMMDGGVREQYKNIIQFKEFIWKSGKLPGIFNVIELSISILLWSSILIVNPLNLPVLSSRKLVQLSLAMSLAVLFFL